MTIAEEEVVELTIEKAHEGFVSGAFTAVELVQAYLDRIESIDRGGVRLNSIITVSAAALDEAAALDAELARTGEMVGPLHGVPIVVKDQIETSGIVTTFGSEAVADYVPEHDATAIAKLKGAGAIILAKTTMPDFATSWFSTSSRSGRTKNPYDLSHDPGGSSSGSAAAVAANLGLVGIGEDTGGSIRLPASFCNLVGVRVTPGLISRTGMSALVETQDTAGPMTRNVADAARLLDVLVGFDAADPFTWVAGRSEGTSFSAALQGASVAGKRLGVLREAFPGTADAESAEVQAVLDEALARLEAAGAELIDVEIPDLMHLVGYTSLYYTRSLQDMNAFLASRPAIGVSSIQEVHREKKYHPKLDLLEGIATGPAEPSEDPEYLGRVLAREDFVRTVASMYQELELDGVLMPDAKLASPDFSDVEGDRWTCLTYPTNTVIASQLQFPAATVPAGFTASGLPVGMEIMVTPFSELRLIRLAKALEDVYRARRAPELTES